MFRGTVTWAQLGCPTKPGFYVVDGKKIEVKQGHIDSAEGEVFALFRVIGMTSPSGETKHKLGTRLD